MKKLKGTLIGIALLLCFYVIIIGVSDISKSFLTMTGLKHQAPPKASEKASSTFDFNTVPAYSGKPYAIIDNNEPAFKDSDLTTKSFESYSDLDRLGRVGAANACLSKDTMPKYGEKRGDISSVHPTGWHSNGYMRSDGYNRCHLIAYELSAENANEKNLATGTRYMNVEGMLPFENQVADYIRETGNHVRYRVTPCFKDDELVCRGVEMEAESVEDKGTGIKFNVYCYNVQDNMQIDYKTGNYTFTKTAYKQNHGLRAMSSNTVDLVNTTDQKDLDGIRKAA